MIDIFTGSIADRDVREVLDRLVFELNELSSSKATKQEQAVVETPAQSQLVFPAGLVFPYAGEVLPSSQFYFCDGGLIDRGADDLLFAAIGTKHGSTSSSNFARPDYRGLMLRGLIAIPSCTGTGSAVSNQATFTNHGLKTGMQVMMTGGALAGLGLNVVYYAIKVDDNTLAFATTAANAFANTRIAISGANTAVIKQAVDPTSTARLPMNAGGASGESIGSVQEDSMQRLYGSFRGTYALGGYDGALFASVSGTQGGGGSWANTTNYTVNFDSSRAARTSLETVSKNANVNYIISRGKL